MSTVDLNPIKAYTWDLYRCLDTHVIENLNISICVGNFVKLPASIAFLAASRKSLTIWGISSVLSLLGVVNCVSSTLLLPICCFSGLSVEDIGACPFGWKTVATINWACNIVFNCTLTLNHTRVTSCPSDIYDINLLLILHQFNSNFAWMKTELTICIYWGMNMWENTCTWDPSNMPNLTKEYTTFGMNCLHNWFPCFNLLFCPYTWCVYQSSYRQ